MSDGKKYELVPVEDAHKRNLPPYRVKALRLIELVDYEEAQPGDLGGYVDGEHNLSQEGECWVADEAWVTDRASVEDCALVYDKARLSDRARARDESKVGGGQGCRKTPPPKTWRMSTARLK